MNGASDVVKKLATAAAANVARHRANQLAATRWSRDSACRPKRFSRNSRLNSGMANHVSATNAMYTIRIGVIHGASAGLVSAMLCSTRAAT